MIAKCVNCGEMRDTSEVCDCHETGRGNLENLHVGEYPWTYCGNVENVTLRFNEACIFPKRREERKESNK